MVIKIDGKKVKKVVIVGDAQAAARRWSARPTGSRGRLAFGKHHLQVIFKPRRRRGVQHSKSRRIMLTVVQGPGAGRLT